MDQRDAPKPGGPDARLRASTEWRVRVSTPAVRTVGGVPRRMALSGLTGTAFFALTMGLSRPAGRPSVRPGGERPGATSRSLSIVVAHTGETFSDVFAEGDRYDDRQLGRLSRMLRDYGSGEVKPIDPALFDVLARLQAQVGQPLRVLSGYRSWRTNRFMHIVGFDVAEHSLHVAGKAVDFMVPGVAAAKLGDLARRCGAGGIGIYRSGFVHVDTGTVRDWVGA